MLFHTRFESVDSKISVAGMFDQPVLIARPFFWGEVLISVRTFRVYRVCEGEVVANVINRLLKYLHERWVKVDEKDFGSLECNNNY